MPDQCGYRYVSRRIPLALLRRQGTPVARPFFWTHRPMGETRVHRPAHREFPEPCAWLRWSASFFVRPAEGEKAAALCQAHVSKLGALSKRLGTARLEIGGINGEQRQTECHFVA